MPSGKPAVDTVTTYDLVAAEYAERFQDEMDDKPFDRECLDRLLAETRGIGPICDLGCGPGQVARYLHRQGADVLGVDLSPSMIDQARRLNPAVPFHVGDMLGLPDADGSWGGIAAFYSIIHLPPHAVIRALAEMRRVLRPGGVLLLAFHVGDGITHLDEWWGRRVSIDFAFYQPRKMEEWLVDAGYQLIETLVREPDPRVEVATTRAYLFAEKGQPAG